MTTPSSRATSPVTPPATPLVTLVMTVPAGHEHAPHRTDPSSPLAVTVASLQAQTVLEWELLLVGDGGPGDVSAVGDDPRVRVVSGGQALDRALEECRGRWFGLIDAGDTLDPQALELVWGDVADIPDAAIVYTDEDLPVPSGMTGSHDAPAWDATGSDGATGSKGDTRATRVPRYKPDWSPERQRHGDVLGRLCLLRTEVVRAVGGWNTDAGEAAAYDLALRVSEHGGAAVHVPEILYHAASTPTSCESYDAAARQAAQRHLQRIGAQATVEPGPVPGAHRIRRTLDPAVSVSVIMPTAWKQATVRGATRCLPVEAVRTMVSHTSHQSVQFVIVYDEPVPEGALENLRELLGDRLLAIPYRKPFNFSEKCNIGFLHATGDVIVLANDDLEPISDHWLESLVAPVLEPDVGLVGAKLLFEDDTVQHGGHLHLRDTKRSRPVLAYRGVPGDAVGEFHSLVVNREASGVTGACVAVRRDVFEQVGGLTEDLPANFNDVDLSLKVELLGLRILWLADPVLYHFESKSRKAVVEEFESDFMFERWGGFAGDPYLPWLMPPVPRRRPVSDVAERQVLEPQS